MAQEGLGGRRRGGGSSGVSFRGRWADEVLGGEGEVVESKEVRRVALKVDDEEGGDVETLLPALRSSARALPGYSSVLIRTFRDDRIPFNGSGAFSVSFWCWASEVEAVVARSAERIRLPAEDDEDDEDDDEDDEEDDDEDG